MKLITIEHTLQCFLAFVYNVTALMTFGATFMCSTLTVVLYHVDSSVGVSRWRVWKRWSNFLLPSL